MTGLKQLQSILLSTKWSSSALILTLDVAENQHLLGYCPDINICFIHVKGGSKILLLESIFPFKLSFLSYIL